MKELLCSSNQKYCIVFVPFLFPLFINTENKYFLEKSGLSNCHVWGDGSEAGVLLLLLLLSKAVKVCCKLRAENSSVAKEVEALGVVWLGTSPSSSNVLVGVAGARVTCQWLKKKCSYNRFKSQVFKLAYR